MISTYNEPEPIPIHNLSLIIAQRIKIFGLLVLDPILVSKYEDKFYRVVPTMVKTGKLKYVEDRTIGLENAGQAMIDLLSGKARGKSIVVVADEE